jgi:methyl-accepting chemotaxis protein
VLLSRLRIRGKLAALIILPLLIIVGLSAGIAVSQFNSARAASDTVRSVNIGSGVGLILAGLQTERLESVGYLAGVANLSDVEATASNVDEQVSDLRHQYGSAIPAQLNTALDGIAGLDPLRQRVDTDSTTATAIVATYRNVIDNLIQATRLVDNINTGSSAGREVLALDTLLQVDELTNESATILLQLAAYNESPPATGIQPTLIVYSGDQAAIDQLLPRFTAYATSDEIALHDLVTQAFLDRFGPDFSASFTANPAGTASTLAPAVVYPQTQSFVVLGRFAEQKTAADVIATVQQQRSTALDEAYLALALGLLVVGLVAAGGVVIARSVAVPLANLTASTNRVAQLAERELMRVADDEAENTEPIRFDPVHITSDDEIGELARAFERISLTSVNLVGRQVASRRNVAQMFGHVGRRTQNLVGRQIALIDGLEAQETDNKRLGELYRLDHLTSRLRRNASSLVALSGSPDQGNYFAPLALVDVIRLALGEIEEYTRVDVNAPADLMVMPSAINDSVLLLAELMENATTFSPPHMRVSVTAVAHPGRVTIVDHGIGLSPERLAEENARLAQRERLDLAPTEVLGLFVVGRLARRHNLGVVLTNTPGGGVTVTIDVAGILMPASAARPGPIAAPALTPPPAAPVFAPPQAQELVRAERASHAALMVSDYEDAHGVFDDANGLFDLPSLDRATRAIESSRPWNAFELPQPALTAGPAPQPQAEAPVEPRVRLEWTHADTGPLPTFTPPVATSVTQPITMPQPAGIPLSRRDGTYRAPGEDDNKTVVMPTVSGLTRRVPGATIRMDQPTATRQNVRPQDPDEVWDLVQQFESGVARALDEVRSEPTEEDATR